MSGADNRGAQAGSLAETNPSVISVRSASGDWMKTLALANEPYLYHRRFGFIPESKLEERSDRRERFGLKVDRDAIACRFRVERAGNGFRASALEGCSVDGDLLKTSFGDFRIAAATPVSAEALKRLNSVEEGEDTKLWKYALLAMLFVGGSLVFFPRAKEEAAPEILAEPVKVTVVPERQKQKAVTVPAVMSELPQNLKVQDKETKRAIQQNLGFLGLLGKKNLSKALGGMPSTIKDASPGAGAGGKEGSGGEYLVGLGAGVKRATVGNTGVAGLGGIGTKGAGGGAGGYGNSMVGSGEGRSLSKVALSNEITLEGGLDRAVIQATIAKYLSQVRACYEEQLQSNPGLAGQVTMGFAIGGEGDVQTSQVARSTLGNATTENCIAQRMKSWKFPKPVGGVTVKVVYPFLLRPAGA